MNRKDIGERIKKLREERKWQKGTLATLAGLAPSYIPVLENGEKCPTIETMESICFAFGITLSQFFLEDEKIEVLSEQEKNLLESFRKLPTKKQKALIDLL